jgi:hypothetical protein
MRNHELRGIFVMGLLCLAALGVFLFGVLAKAEPAGNVTRFRACPAPQLRMDCAAGIVGVNLPSLATIRQGISEPHRRAFGGNESEISRVEEGEVLCVEAIRNPRGGTS